MQRFSLATTTAAALTPEHAAATEGTGAAALHPQRVREYSKLDALSSRHAGAMQENTATAW